jgi:acetyltransferase-like isoleucine patch superfamily enzyme
MVGTDPFAQSGLTQARGVLWSLRQDLAGGLRNFWVNSIGGAELTPRVLRYVVYKLSPHDIRTPLVRPHMSVMGAHLTIGRGCEIARGVQFEAIEQITIGESTTIGAEVLVLTSTHDISPEVTFARQPTLLPVTIGSRCFIGSRVIVCAGVTIADGCIVGAGSVVTRDLTVPGLYAGAPARLIRPAPVPDVAPEERGSDAVPDEPSRRPIGSSEVAAPLPAAVVEPLGGSARAVRGAALGS